MHNSARVVIFTIQIVHNPALCVMKIVQVVRRIFIATVNTVCVGRSNIFTRHIFNTKKEFCCQLFYHLHKSKVKYRTNWNFSVCWALEIPVCSRPLTHSASKIFLTLQDPPTSHIIIDRSSSLTDHYHLSIIIIDQSSSSINHHHQSIIIIDG